MCVCVCVCVLVCKELLCQCATYWNAGTATKPRAKRCTYDTSAKVVPRTNSDSYLGRAARKVNSGSGSDTVGVVARTKSDSGLGRAARKAKSDSGGNAAVAVRSGVEEGVVMRRRVERSAARVGRSASESRWVRVSKRVNQIGGAALVCLHQVPERGV